MYLFFFQKKIETFCTRDFLKSELQTFIFTFMIKKPTQSIKIIPFYFCDKCKIIEINTLMNKLTRVKLTKYLPRESS